MHRSQRIAQTLLEYAVIISVVLLIFVTMQVYAKRGVQGRIKDMADNFIGKDIEQDKENKQYSSGLTKSAYQTVAESTMHKTGSAASTDYEISEVVDRQGTESSVSDESWIDQLPPD